jgi:hypothetical protein
MFRQRSLTQWFPDIRKRGPSGSKPKWRKTLYPLAFGTERLASGCEGSFAGFASLDSSKGPLEFCRSNFPDSVQKFPVLRNLFPEEFVKAAKAWEAAHRD